MKFRLFILSILIIISHNSFADIRFATYNIRNFDKDRLDVDQKRTDKDLLYSIIIKTNAELIAVQEIYDEIAFKQFMLDYLPNYGTILSRCGGSGKQKLGFIYKKDKLNLLSFYEDSNISMSKDCHVGLRPAVIAHFRQNKSLEKFAAVSVHLKAGDKDEDFEKRILQLEYLKQLMDGLKFKGQKNIVVMGDFNSTRYNQFGHEFEAFSDFVSKEAMYDFSSAIECSSYWYAGKEEDIFKSSLLDHILISNSFLNKYKTKSTNVLTHCQKHRCEDRQEDQLGSSYNSVSDHCPVISTLR